MKTKKAIGKRFKTIFSVALASFVLLAACSNGKKALSADAYTTNMEQMGFSVYDATEQFDPALVDTVLLATNGSFQLEFYIMNSADSAIASFNGNKTSFEAYKTEDAEEDFIEEDNYAHYQLTTNDTYFSISHIDNTFLYCSTSSEYKEEVQVIFEALGY